AATGDRHETAPAKLVQDEAAGMAVGAVHGDATIAHQVVLGSFRVMSAIPPGRFSAADRRPEGRRSCGEGDFAAHACAAASRSFCAHSSQHTSTVRPPMVTSIALWSSG